MEYFKEISLIHSKEEKSAKTLITWKVKRKTLKEHLKILRGLLSEQPFHPLHLSHKNGQLQKDDCCEDKFRARDFIASVVHPYYNSWIFWAAIVAQW